MSQDDWNHQLHSDRIILDKAAEAIRKAGLTERQAYYAIKELLSAGLVFQEVDQADLVHYREAWGEARKELRE